MRIKLNTIITFKNDHIVIGTAALTEWDKSSSLGYGGNGSWGIVFINYQFNGRLNHIYKHWQMGESSIYKQVEGGYHDNNLFRRSITRITTDPRYIADGKYDNIDFMSNGVLPSIVANELLLILQKGQLY